MWFCVFLSNFVIILRSLTLLLVYVSDVLFTNKVLGSIRFIVGWIALEEAFGSIFPVFRSRDHLLGSGSVKNSRSFTVAWDVT